MTEMERVEIQGRALLLYDGVCGLCNRIVQMLLKRDRLGKLRYAPLQSELGKEILARFGQYTFPDGVVLITDALTPHQRLYQRSDAVAASLLQINGPWSLLGRALRVVPRSLRESGYSVVARVRYRIFGRYASCPIPTPEQRSRVLGVYG